MRSFDEMEHDERWLGFGYLGARRAELARRSEFVAEVDRRILAHAEREGWTDEQLFAWANSKLGRWLGDVTFGSVGEFTDAEWDRRVVRGNLLDEVEVDL